MDAGASLRQTATHLFDSVRFSSHARELDEAARAVEETLDGELARLEGMAEELAKVIGDMKGGSDALAALSLQLTEFLATAKEQAVEKLKATARELVTEQRASASNERDKALKSLEAYLATDPIPIVEHMVRVALMDDSYQAYSKFVCEGGIRYEFALAAQNSRLFHHELSLSELGHELKIPVRYSRALLKKGRVPGFERLDQYILVSAETSDGRIHATFRKGGGEASLKVVTSGAGEADFIGIEYQDQSESVNVMNDPALSAHVDLPAVRKAMNDLVEGLKDVAGKKVALSRFSIGDKDSLGDIDYDGVLSSVLGTLGASYRDAMKKPTKAGGGGADANLAEFVHERMKVLGAEAALVVKSLGPL